MNGEDRKRLEKIAECLHLIDKQVGVMGERIQQLKDGESGDIPEIKQHLIQLNDAVAKVKERSASNKTSIRNLWIMVSIYAASLGTIIGLLFRLT